MTEQTQEAVEQPQEQSAGLTLQHIELAIRVIDMASARGAIRGEEMATVGNLRETFAGFLRSAGVASPEQEAAPDASQPEEEAEAAQ